MLKEEKLQATKRFYKKPVVRIIALAAEEVLQPSCKFSGTTGPYGTPGTCLGAPTCGASS